MQTIDEKVKELIAEEQANAIQQHTSTILRIQQVETYLPWAYKVVDAGEAFGFRVSQPRTQGLYTILIELNGVENCRALLPLFGIMESLLGWENIRSEAYPSVKNIDYVFNYKTNACPFRLIIQAYFSNCRKVPRKPSEPITPPVEYDLVCDVAEEAEAPANPPENDDILV